MAINLSNVNISLDDFQRISSGWFNAGEGRLEDEHSPLPRWSSKSRRNNPPGRNLVPHGV